MLRCNCLPPPAPRGHRVFFFTRLAVHTDDDVIRRADKCRGDSVLGIINGMAKKKILHICSSFMLKITSTPVSEDQATPTSITPIPIGCVLARNQRVKVTGSTYL